MKHKIKCYIVTFLVCYAASFLILLQCETADGEPYPVGSAIIVAMITALMLSFPVWCIQLIVARKNKKRSVTNDETLEYALQELGRSAAIDGSQMSKDELMSSIMDRCAEQGWISTSFIQRNFKLGYEKTARIIDNLERNGWVEPYSEKNHGIRKLYLSKNEWNLIRGNYSDVAPETKIRMPEMDLMDGHEFEEFCAVVLRGNGFNNVEVTKSSGDFGIDILAEKEGITYAIQCKCYSDKVGNHAVQEAYSGARYYKRMVPAVMTNQYFTDAAKETARETGVLLWDKNKLEDMIQKANK